MKKPEVEVVEVKVAELRKGLRSFLSEKKPLIVSSFYRPVAVILPVQEMQFCGDGERKEARRRVLAELEAVLRKLYIASPTWWDPAMMYNLMPAQPRKAGGARARARAGPSRERSSKFSGRVILVRWTAYHLAGAGIPPGSVGGHAWRTWRACLAVSACRVVSDLMPDGWLPMLEW